MTRLERKILITPLSPLLTGEQRACEFCAENSSLGREVGRVFNLQEKTNKSRQVGRVFNTISLTGKTPLQFPYPGESLDRNAFTPVTSTKIEIISKGQNIFTPVTSTKIVIISKGSNTFIPERRFE